MRILALALALCFTLAPLEAATRHTAGVHKVKAKKGKNPRKGKKPVKHAGNKA